MGVKVPPSWGRCEDEIVNICKTVSAHGGHRCYHCHQRCHCSISVCQAHVRSGHTAEIGLTPFLPREACAPVGRQTDSHQITDQFGAAAWLRVGVEGRP